MIVISVIDCGYDPGMSEGFHEDMTASVDCDLCSMRRMGIQPGRILSPYLLSTQVVHKVLRKNNLRYFQ